MMFQDYQLFRKQYEDRINTHNGKLAFDQEKRYIEPFQLWGNIFYVGDSEICVHIVDTGDGLLMIDSGNCGATAMLLHSIWKMGFNPENVKWIILSHGHFDHIGGARFFQVMFGSKIYLGEPDYQMFLVHPELSLIQESANLADQIFIPDEVIRDGDCLHFGNTSIQCYLVPGHTAGCVALFFDAVNGSKKLRVGYYGGFGFNTLTKEYLYEIGDTELRMRDIYFQSIEKVKDQPVDIFLGNHPENNNTLTKRSIMLNDPGCENPFVNEKEWFTYLCKKQDDLRDLIASGE